MSNATPTVINTYQKAIVDNNTILFDECFNEDAVVNDNGETFTGLAAIKDWGDGLSKMKLNTEITNVAVSSEAATISTHVSGDFKRSPLSFIYSMTLRDDKISTLTIKVDG